MGMFFLSVPVGLLANQPADDAPAPAGNILLLIAPVIGVVVFAIIFISYFRMLARWLHNNRQPVLTVPARVVSKWTTTSGGGNVHAVTQYHASFEFASGEMKEFQIHLGSYKLFSEGDRGTLTHQGTRFHEFKRGDPVTPAESG